MKRTNRFMHTSSPSINNANVAGIRTYEVLSCRVQRTFMTCYQAHGVTEFLAHLDQRAGRMGLAARVVSPR